MKKLLLVSLPLLAFAFSCTLFGDNITIRNNSSYSVTFEFSRGNRDTHTLASGRTRTFSASDASVRTFSTNPSGGRVSFRRPERFEGVFFDTVPYSLDVRNTLDFSITLSERNGHMATSEITVNADETIIAGNIYTSRPRFLTEPPARVNYVISGGVILVTIY